MKELKILVPFMGLWVKCCSSNRFFHLLFYFCVAFLSLCSFPRLMADIFKYPSNLSVSQVTSVDQFHSATSQMVADSLSSHPGGVFGEDLLPQDVAHHIASLLPVSDLCSLGSTSRCWRDLCNSDRIWSTLSKKRWPAINLEESQLLDTTGKHEAKDEDSSTASTKVWKGVYVKWHREMADRAATVVKFVQTCSSHESLEVGDYLRAVNTLCNLQLGFKDVQLYIFTKENNVLLNLIGLHYSIFMLGVQTDDIAEALCLCPISNRRVCVRWWKLGRWVYGFRQRDEVRVSRVSLLDILKPENQEILWVLERGVIHEVLRVQISTEDARRSGWDFNFQQLG